MREQIVEEKEEMMRVVLKGNRKMSQGIEKDCGVKGGECVNSWKNDPEETLVMQKKEMSRSVIFIRKW